ncbi:hypothetical protein RPMA_13290 [Tardiphaga alba]|uniref:Uncharacterized protein n=1 Tax=Tardiphaga alba TaxID=340268 RepID=A0ABX8A7R8_9BRAD|nr:hypothetical protein [Tardiphaga alba]QUS39703.1 hypothetical protein RPMA_13290 [Tardiphaga alba]
MSVRSGLMIGAATLLLSGGAAFAQGATGGSLGNDNKTLSGSSSEPRAAKPAPRERSERRQAAPRSRGEGGGGGFDGVWSISSAGTSGCSDTLTEQFVVSGGRMTGSSGSGRATVSPNGAVRGAGNYSGIGVTSQGRLSGRTGSGTFQRSDGCSGRWVASKQ